GRRHPCPGSPQRAGPHLRPRLARTGRAAVPPGGAVRRADRADQHDRRPAAHGVGREVRGRPAAPAQRRPRHLRAGHARRRPGRRPRGQGGGAGLAGAVLRRPRRGVPQGRGPAGRAVAPEAQRRHDAGAEQDRLPGRDRRGLRADRLLALQRALRPADHGRAAGVRARRLEPGRPPTARGLRLRDHAVQLHRHRRQPAHRPGAHGQHRRLEALADAAVRRPSHDAAAGGRGPAAGRDQPGHRRRHPGVGGGPGRPRPGRHPLHRVHAGVPAAVADGGGEHRLLPRLPAHRRRDRRQGLRRRARLGRRRRAADRARPRRLRVPGPEVLGGLPRLRPAQRLVPAQGRPGRDHRVAVDGRRHGLLELHGRGHRPQVVLQAVRRPGPGDARRRADRGRRRHGRRQRGLLRPADHHRGHRPRPRRLHDRVLRPRARGARLRRRGVRRGADPDGVGGALRAHRRRHRPGPGGDRARAAVPAQRRGQLLRQRQADRRRRRPAALRGRAGVGDQRQGRRPAEPAALDQHPLDQGDVRPGDRPHLPAHAV
ncbi:MAG: Delta-1-pyrroline-5-carboxylate dehydrogenase, partial [uncultured Blastococcus sp.]